MRPGQNKRSRGRNSGNNPHFNRQRMPHRIQTFDSNGPNVKIRGNAYQVFERYVALAREAAAAGDRIAAENLYQHAEHYYRIMNANGDPSTHGAPRPTTPADIDPPSPDEERRGFEDERRGPEEERRGPEERIAEPPPVQPDRDPLPPF
jgi:hypothetical protein